MVCRSTRSVLILLALLAGSNAHSIDAPDWLKETLKQSNPNELAYIVFADACGFSEEDLDELVKGVLIRSRIKPSGDWALANLYLSVVVQCMDITVGGRKTGKVIQAKVDFGRRNPKPAILYDSGFGTLLISVKEDYALSRIKAAVEDAVTAYLEANFELSPD